ncbi:hypothetical protein [Frigidibacter sp. ROC022]|uniref:hypothetical protein n=1 Tax=Frigidibacter sp. ROC022 TaxID=2971796 RepID=UPI00215B17FF|nr:hypothetical protein [Frigidibacter sp. ROC022]MCR8726501.1 hypothetical protein [Frigidibacter sp. ROC022]
MASGTGRLRRLGRPALALLAVAALSGCMELPAGGIAGGGSGSGPALKQSVRLSSAGIDVTGPPGYCLDESASHPSGTGAFAAFRRCEVLRGGSVALSNRAVLGVSVSDTPNPQPVVAGSEDKLIAYFKTEAGRRVLSRSGKASTVTLLQSSDRDGVVWLQVRDTSPTLALDATYWRAIFDAKGRIVTVTVTGFAEGPLTGARARALAEGLVARIRKANSGDATATRADAGATDADFNGFLRAPPPL